MTRDVVARLYDLGGRVRARFSTHCVVLLYHRIADSPDDPYMLSVTPRHFAEHLQVIRQHARPVRLHEVARGLAAGSLPRLGVCVTFDDGYQDNLNVALPLLEQYDVPATMFMTTGRIGRDREFWWDELQRILLLPGELPARLRLHIDDRPVDIELGTAASYSASDAARDAGWTITDTSLPTARHAVLRTMYQLLHGRGPVEQAEVLDRLVAWSGRVRTVRDAFRALEPEEVAGLPADGVLEVGGHTVNHPALPAQPVTVQREEIAGCRATLEEWLGRPVRSFAYPYGEFSDDAIAEVRRAGYDHACACMGQPTRRNSDPFRIPRIDAQDIDGDALARLLSRVLR